MRCAQIRKTSYIELLVCGTTDIVVTPTYHDSTLSAPTKKLKTQNRMVAYISKNCISILYNLFPNVTGDNFPGHIVYL